MLLRSKLVRPLRHLQQTARPIHISAPSMAKDSRHPKDQEWRGQLPYSNDDPNFKPKYNAQCHCGRVKYSTSADPVSSVMCHCETCQTTHGAIAQWAAIMKKETLRFDKSSFDHLEFYNTHDKQPGRAPPCKVSCRACGTLLADEGRNMWLAYPASFHFHSLEKGDAPKAWQPTDHIFYAQRVVDLEIKDKVRYWTGMKDKSELMHGPAPDQDVKGHHVEEKVSKKREKVIDDETGEEHGQDERKSKK